MGRSLKLTLDDIQVGAQHNPAFRVRVYDVRSTTDTIREVIQQQQPLPPALQFLTGPMDFTDFVTFVDIFPFWTARQTRPCSVQPQSGAGAPPRPWLSHWNHSQISPSCIRLVLERMPPPRLAKKKLDGFFSLAMES